MRIYPVRQRLGPARAGKGQAGGAHDGHEDMCLADFTPQPVDHHGHRVPGIVDEHPVAAQMRLPHGDRQPGFPAPVELAKTAVLIPIWMKLDILVPQDLQCDMLALEFAIDRRPIGFGTPPVPLLIPSVRDADSRGGFPKRRNYESMSSGWRALSWVQRLDCETTLMQRA